MTEASVSPRRVGVVVDHPSRDLPGAIMLALELAGRGIETALVPLYDQGLDVPLLGLDALVLNFARPMNEPLAREYARLGIPLYVLDTEGGILSDAGRASPEAIAAYVRDSDFGRLLTGYFFWGEALRDAFRATNAMPEQRLHLTGSPRFDYYTAGWSGIEAPKRQGHVLVNTNFPVVNPRFSADRASDTEALRSIGMDEAYIKRLQAENRRVMDGMIELVGRLARDLPSRLFVVRPHPFERHEAYRDALAGCPNVVVDGEGPVLGALRGAHALLHCNCGTAIEALMLGLAPLSPEWLNSDFMRTHASLPSKASRRVHNYEELRSLLDSDEPAAGFDMTGLYRATAHRFFYRNDGRAAARVADVLEEAGDQAVKASRSLATSLRGSYSSPRLSQRLQAMLATVFGSAAVRDWRILLRPARAQKRIELDQVLRASESFADFRGIEAPRVAQARHPVTGVPLSTVLIASPAAMERS